MSTSDTRLIHRTAAETDTLRRLTLRAHAMIGAALLLGSVLAPLGTLVDADEDTTMGVDWAGRVPLTLRRLIGFCLDPPSDHRLGGLEAHPFAIPGGLFLVALGTAVVTVAVVVNLLLCWVVLAEVRTATRRVAVAAAVVLIAGALALWLGLTWLPDNDDATPEPAWGLWLPFIAAVWLISGLRARRALDE